MRTLLRIGLACLVLAVPALAHAQPTPAPEKPNDTSDEVPSDDAPDDEPLPPRPDRGTAPAPLAELPPDEPPIAFFEPPAPPEVPPPAKRLNVDLRTSKRSIV